MTAVRRLNALLIAACIVAGATPAWAQTDGEPDPSRVRLRIGPLLVNPTVSITNIGVDNNVFNEPSDRTPKRDFTMTITPATEYWLRFGVSWITGTIKEDLLWYQDYATERAANTSYALNWRVPLNRVVIRSGLSFLNTRERPGFEIDARAARHELDVNGSLEVRALSKTSLIVNGARLRVDFDDAARYFDANLHTELNRVSTTVGGALKFQVSTLTAISLNVSRIQDRFDFSPLRDSNSTAGTVMVTFDPAALIKGSASFGYRDFKPLSPGVDAYQGTTASANLTYTLLGSTRVTVGGTRDVQYSFDVDQPYYLLSGVDLSVAQQVFGPFDVVGRFGRQKLAYRDRTGANLQPPDRVDFVHSYGGGVGYHIGKELRLGVNLDKYRRISDVPGRQYDDLRIGSSLTYGF
jgi:hypothetical protein